MPDWGDWIAAFALVISLVLAGIRIAEWRATPEFHASLDWLAASGEPIVLHVVVSNRGRARGGIRALLLSPTPTHNRDTAFSHYPMLSKLPAMVEPGDLAPFGYEVKAEDTRHTLTRDLLNGGFRYVLLIDQAHRVHAFPIPERPPESETRRNSYGRVAKR